MAGNALGAMKRIAGRLGLQLEVYAARIAGGEKYCWRCRALHPIAAFNVDVTRRDGLDPSCRKARTANNRDRYQPRPKASKLGTFFAPTRDGDKKQARARVNHHVDVGLLPDPNTIPCFDCGHVYTDGERRHEYDHFRGYAAGHQLDVQAVCTTCHHRRTAFPDSPTHEEVTPMRASGQRPASRTRRAHDDKRPGANRGPRFTARSHLGAKSAWADAGR